MTMKPMNLLFCLFAFSAPGSKKAKKQSQNDHKAKESAILLFCFPGCHDPRKAK